MGKNYNINGVYNTASGHGRTKKYRRTSIGIRYPFTGTLCRSGRDEGAPYGIFLLFPLSNIKVFHAESQNLNAYWAVKFCL